ncbi:MAG: hypothetical protein M0P15_04355 [Bacteroides sp.]|nr:hypothetical protein [Bacteroides sp.]
MKNIKVDDINQAISEAKNLGAVKYITTSFKDSEGKEEVYSYHFFNRDNKEIAYFIVVLIKFFGLTVLKDPRSWSRYFLDDKRNSKFITI